MPSGEAGRVVIFLHGVFGRGRNFGTLARRLVEARPDLAVALVDLRLHGDTGSVEGPHSLQAAAEDLESVVRSVVPRRVAAVVGHSLGGRVALAYGGTRPELPIRILDITPGSRPAALRGAGGVSEPLKVLTILEGLAKTFSDRQAFIDEVVDAGQPLAIARWLATNLVRLGEGAGYRLDMDLPGLRELLEDHYRTDLWHAARGDCRFLLAGRSEAGGASDRARLMSELPSQVDVLPEADHWLHRGDPEGVLTWLLGHLP